MTMKSKKRPSQRQSLETDATSVPDAAFHDGFVHSGRISLMRGLLQPNDSNVSACFSEALILSSGMGDTDVWMGRNTPTVVRVNWSCVSLMSSRDVMPADLSLINCKLSIGDSCRIVHLSILYPKPIYVCLGTRWPFLFTAFSILVSAKSVSIHTWPMLLVARTFKCCQRMAKLRSVRKMILHCRLEEESFHMDCKKLQRKLPEMQYKKER